MCGIAGIHAPTDRPPPTRAELAAMIGQLAHRGPDGTTMLLDGSTGLAHARLSLTDLAGGAQPFHSSDGTIAVICNGEIFNHRALRAELEADGIRLRGRCDAEVLPHLYQRHGERFLERLDGQFAIALWDRRNQRLLLARDRFGIRPLFHAWHQGRLVFGSEIKSLLALPGLALGFDPIGLAMVLSTWGAMAPQTVFAGIASLGPGQRLTLDGRGLRIEDWWQWRPMPPDAVANTACGTADDGADDGTGDDARLVAGLRERLEQAVEQQLRADAPVALTLSGGLDSAAIAALASRIARRDGRPPPDSFGLVFDDPQYDESGWQQRIAAALGLRHHPVRVDDDAIAARFAQTVWHAETPLVRTAPVPMLLLAEALRDRGYRAALTGEAADELFAGYDLFREARIRRFAAASTDPQRRAQRARLLDRLYPWLGLAPAAAGRLGRLGFLAALEDPAAADFAHRPRIAATRRALATMTPDWQRRIDRFDPAAALAGRAPADFGDWTPLQRDQFIEMQSLLSAHLLPTQGDRPAMAASIETRLPFLDHRVIDFAARLPDRYKLRGLQDKRILRAAVADLLPADCRNRPKQPYRAPDARCFFTAGRPRPWVAELLSNDRIADTGLFDPVIVGRLSAKFCAGGPISFADSTSMVFILSTQILADRYLTGRPAIDAGLPATVAVAPELSRIP